MTTALLTHPDCLGHVTPPGHPEQVARLDAVMTALEGLDLDRRQAPLAAEDDLLRCHPRAHVAAIRDAVPDQGWRAIDADTHLSPGSLAAAYRAVGAVVRAVDLVLGGEAANAFCAVRPPGHHAEAETAMGFCLFGSVAIGAKHALDHHGLDRVAVLDFDVHHGNGTQALLEDDARVLFVSSHQRPLWPGTGEPSDDGPHGTVRNIGLAPGAGGREFHRAWERALAEVEAFAPGLVLVSAGFDAHRDAPLANLNLDTGDFAWITGEICALADRVCGGRVVSALEGGYDLDALGDSVRAHVETLMEHGA